MKTTLWMVLFIFYVAFLIPASWCQETVQRARLVSEGEAAEILSKALEQDGRTKLPGYTVEPASRKADFPDFYFFQPLHYDPGGVAVIGYFAVDERTGDVWDGVVCRKLNSRQLRSLQKDVRKRIGLTDQAYRRIVRSGPMCGPGEKPLK
jgi:hypothetical protein